MRAGIALGSNLGDRLGPLTAARETILHLNRVTPPFLASSVYETEPVNCEADAPNFLNAVIELSYEGEPLQLFQDLRAIEGDLGRPSVHQRNVSRSIDIDLLYFDDVLVITEQLVLPHPRMAERRFVLQPLADIQPNRILPGQTKTIRELLASAPQLAKVERAISQWGHL